MKHNLEDKSIRSSDPIKVGDWVVCTRNLGQLEVDGKFQKLQTTLVNAQ